MKTNRILAIGLSAAFACASMPAAFAAEDAPKTTTLPATPVAPAEQSDAAAETPDATSFRLSAMATVKAVPQTSGVDSHLLIQTEDGQEIQLNIGEQTLVVDNATGLAASIADIKEGDKIFAYYSAAMTRSLPPQSACELILVNVGEGAAASLHEVGTVTTDDKGVTSILNQAGDMVIRTDDKTAFSAYQTKQTVTAADLKPGTRFLAWYEIVALSYPGQTYTERLVVLPDADNADPVETVDAGQPAAELPVETGDAALTIVAGGKTLDVQGTLQDGKLAIVPVRPVAEALGCTISYAQKDGKEFVTIENDTRTMTLEIGVDSYLSSTKIEGAAGTTAPGQLGAAPRIENGTTYAPADLFEWLVGFDVAVADGTVTITPQKA